MTFHLFIFSFRRDFFVLFLIGIGFFFKICSVVSDANRCKLLDIYFCYNVMNVIVIVLYFFNVLQIIAFCRHFITSKHAYLSHCIKITGITCNYNEQYKIQYLKCNTSDDAKYACLSKKVFLFV